MDCFMIFIYFILLFCAIQVLRLVFADGDLVLMWIERFGYKIDRLKHKVVWITGASSGIGEFLAYEMARAGCSIILSARNEDELKRIKNKCISSYQLMDSDILVLPMDVLNIEKHSYYTNLVIEKFGKIDILVNNAGRSQRAWVHETEIAVDREMVELNVIAPISLAKSVLPHMLEKGHGHIVVTSSLAGIGGILKSATYSMTKFAINGWHKSLHCELGKKIDVSIVCPGPVHSNIVASAYTSKLGLANEQPQEMQPNRMSTKRCAELMAIAIANKLTEVWIAKQPTLMFAYVAQYMPSFASWLMIKMSAKALNMREGK